MNAWKRLFHQFILSDQNVFPGWLATWSNMKCRAQTKPKHILYFSHGPQTMSPTEFKRCQQINVLSTWSTTLHTYSQDDEVFRSVWFEHKLLTVENFEAVSFADLSVDFCRSDRDGQQARVLHSECSFEGEIWLFDLDSCSKQISFKLIAMSAATEFMQKKNKRIWRPCNNTSTWQAKKKKTGIVCLGF